MSVVWVMFDYEKSPWPCLISVGPVYDTTKTKIRVCRLGEARWVYAEDSSFLDYQLFYNCYKDNYKGTDREEVFAAALEDAEEWKDTDQMSSPRKTRAATRALKRKAETPPLASKKTEKAATRAPPETFKIRHTYDTPDEVDMRTWTGLKNEYPCIMCGAVFSKGLLGLFKHFRCDHYLNNGACGVQICTVQLEIVDDKMKGTATHVCSLCGQTFDVPSHAVFHLEAIHKLAYSKMDGHLSVLR